MSNPDTKTPAALVLDAAAKTWPKDMTTVCMAKLDAVILHARIGVPLNQMTIADADQALAVFERVRSGELVVFRRANGGFEIRRAPKPATKPPRRPFKFRGRAE